MSGADHPPPEPAGLLTRVGGRARPRRRRVPPDGLWAGRHPEADVVLEEPGASRRHFAVRRLEGAWWVEDLGSANGTRLGELPVRRSRLRAGDVIEAAGARLRFDLVPTEARGRWGRAGRLVPAVAVVLLGVAFRSASGPAGPSAAGAPAAGPAAPAAWAGRAAPQRGVDPLARLAVARRLFAERRLAPANLWRACEAYAQAVAALDSAGAPAPEAASDPRAELTACRAALESWHLELRRAARLLERTGRPGRARDAWGRLRAGLPDPGDPRRLEADRRWRALAPPHGDD